MKTLLGGFESQGLNADHIWPRGFEHWCSFPQARENGTPKPQTFEYL